MPKESKRLKREAHLIALAEAVWENHDRAREFLYNPQLRLGGARPIDLARTDAGTKAVENLLMRLEYSLPA